MKKMKKEEMKEENRRKRRVAIGAVFVMAILMIAAITPAMAYDPKSCGCGDEEGASITPTELRGAVKDKVVNKALENEGVIELQNELTKQGFMQKEPTAYTVPLETEDGLIEVQAAVIPFEKEGTEGKSLMYVYNPHTEDSITVLVEGSVLPLGLTACLLALGGCLLVCTGCVAACTHPIGWVACLQCIGGCGLTCTGAYCVCMDYCCDDLGNQWCCNHTCP